jgi:hypothetical protein
MPIYTQKRAKGYLKAIKERLEKDDPERVPVFTVLHYSVLAYYSTFKYIFIRLHTHAYT